MTESGLVSNGIRFAFLLMVVSALPAFSQETAPEVETKSNSQPNDSTNRSLFDGKTLSGWKQSEFGGGRDVAVVDGAIQLDAGDPLNGITYDGEIPKTNYELSLQARKIAGHDFFCAATFPVAESHCTLVLGGWGGTVVGLSCLDGKDASENETTKYIKFETDRWYSIRIRVTDDRIECWLDDEPIIDAQIAGRKISLRNEVVRSKPLGICSFATQAQLREIKLMEWQASPPASRGSDSKPDK